MTRVRMRLGIWLLRLAHAIMPEGTMVYKVIRTK